MQYYDLEKRELVDFRQQVAIEHIDFSLIITFPHSGNLIPEELLKYIDLDKYYHQLDNEFYLEHVVPTIGTRILPSLNRYVVNLARPREQTLERNTMFGESILKKNLDKDLIEKHLQQQYDTFHIAIEQAIDRMKMIHGFAIVIDCHSLNSVGLPAFADAGKKRAEFVIGTLDSTSCDPWLEKTFLSELNDNKHGWTAVANDPYKGGFITQRYADPKNNVHVLQLEMQRKLFMVETLDKDNIPKDALAFLPQQAQVLHVHLQKAFIALTRFQQ